MKPIKLPSPVSMLAYELSSFSPSVWVMFEFSTFSAKVGKALAHSVTVNVFV